MNRALPLALALTVWSAFCPAAQAQSRTKDPPGYAEAVKQGLNELEAGNYPEAREEFMRAYALFANARSARALGMVEFELRNYADCVRRLEEALSTSVKPLDAQLRAETESLLERARRYLGELSLEVEPDAAQVSIDGRVFEPGQRDRVLLDVGSHALEVQATGYLTDRRTIRVTGGERNQLRISLALAASEPADGPVAATPLQSPAPAPTRSERTPAYKKWWVWTAVLVVAAAGATTAAVLLTRDDPKEETRPVTGANPTGPALFALRSF